MRLFSILHGTATSILLTFLMPFHTRIHTHAQTYTHTHTNVLVHTRPIPNSPVLHYVCNDCYTFPQRKIQEANAIIQDTGQEASWCMCIESTCTYMCVQGTCTCRATHTCTHIQCTCTYHRVPGKRPWALETRGQKGGGRLRRTTSV